MFKMRCGIPNAYILEIKWSRHRPGVAQRVGRGIALLFHDHSTRSGWVVSSTPRPHFTPGIDPVHIVQEAGWAPGSVWTGGKSRPHRDSIPGRPARSSVAIPTERRGPHILVITMYKTPVQYSSCVKNVSIWIPQCILNIAKDLYLRRAWRWLYKSRNILP